jgi:hypothetical protein
MADDLIDRLQAMLDTIEHATIATVSAQGQPWNTPVYFARERMSLYWTSRADAQHSINIRDNGHAFIVIYDSSRQDASASAAYIEAQVSELTDQKAIEKGLGLVYTRRGKPTPRAAEFCEPSRHRVYHAAALRVWTNVLHADVETPWDERIEIVLGDA